ncbi:MAG: PQQ-dependent sugar dehydrogenase [Bacteroidota bacterium]|nr:PQQ-dependent sugar dehydrogenase [Bacteroidota bacterium]
MLKQRIFYVVAFLLSFFSICSNAQYQLSNAFPKLNFLQPLDLQQPDDGTNRLFVVTQQGKIYVFSNDSTTAKAKVFLDLSDKVKAGGELGLLGMVFHPDFKNNPYFYVDYTLDDTLRSRISRFTITSSNPDSADKNSETILLEVNQPFPNHKAGQLAFGPDGYLYVGFGDGGSGGDPFNNAQNNTVILGKMLRIDVNKSQNGKNYSIPTDNPFVGNTKGYREEIYAYGLRNPWRFSFDPVTKWLWVADVGQDLWEEIDIMTKGGNYGWRIMEGKHCYNPSSNCDTTGLIEPIWEYGHNEQGGRAITGGYVYRGKALPQLYGKYIFADFVAGKIWALSYDGKSQATNELIINSEKNISSFGIDRSNELFVCSFDGNIYRLVSLGPTSVAGEQPRTYGLYDNFPNPFNPQTTITADIMEKGNVKLLIYDLEGKVVDTLFNGIMEPGKYQFHWDASNFPSGVYIYELTAGNFKAAKKMVLVK